MRLVERARARSIGPRGEDRAMDLAVVAVQKRARLEEKGRTRAWRTVSKKFPDGSDALASLPVRRAPASAEETSERAADDEYCAAIDRCAGAFGEQRRSVTTAAEHAQYMRIFDGWLLRSGFGSYVEAVGVTDEASGVVTKVTVKARVDATGRKKVVRPQLLVGYLLQMAVGSKQTPKGGHLDDLKARAALETASACGKRIAFKRKEGKCGYGAYGDESWSLQALQKRVYAVRDFYRIELKGVHSADNPGWDDAVCAVLSALALLIGKKPLHVPKVRGCMRARRPQHP